MFKLLGSSMLIPVDLVAKSNRPPLSASVALKQVDLIHKRGPDK